jgi:hypothetical protein
VQAVEAGEANLGDENAWWWIVLDDAAGFLKRSCFDDVVPRVSASARGNFDADELPANSPAFRAISKKIAESHYENARGRSSFVTDHVRTTR